ncbi:MAG: PKD domain-containing protein [Bacteroidota bacterium]
MKKHLLSCLILLFSAQLVLGQAAGVRDAFGYFWQPSNTTSTPRPTYNWIDIRNTGTLISGLSDDNVVGPFSMGFNFHYYWFDYNQFYIGSNGYISFQNNNISSLAIGFPTKPTADGKNDVVAPFLCDLTLSSSLSSAPNPGRVYLYTNNLDTCIISYENVPYWNNNAQQWGGSNTFQVIFSGVDSSVTFQYRGRSGAYDAAYNLAQNPAVIGIENATGTIGLTVSNNAYYVQNRAIKFYYPDTTSFQALDVQPRWVKNEQTGGFFVSANGSSVLGASRIENVGNVPMNASTSVRLRVSDFLGNVIHRDTATIPNLLLRAGQQVNFTKGVTPQFPTTYFYEVTTGNTTDINSTNDTLIAEMVVVDTTGFSANLTFWSGNPPQTGNNISWSGGNRDEGVGIYIEPPYYPCEISEVNMFIDVQGTQVGTTSFSAAIFDDNGPAGTGTELWRDSISTTQVRDFDWNTFTLSAPIRIDSGGVYIGWFMTGENVAIGTEVIPPFSNRGYEILGGTWSDLRFNGAQEPLIQVKIDKICSVGSPINFGADTTVCSADSFRLDAGSGRASYTWSTGATSQTIPVTAPGTYFVEVQDSASCRGNDTINISINTSPTVALPGDQIFCDGDSFIVDPGPGFVSYMWNDGTTTQTYTAKNTSVLVLTVSDTNGCTASDDIRILTNPTPMVDLGPDIDDCAGKTIPLSAGLGFQTYNWSDGSLGNSLTVSQTGIYYCTVVSFDGCVGSDTVSIRLEKGKVDLPGDTTICEGDSLFLDPGPGYDAYLWFDGSNTQTYTVKDSGLISLTILEGACQGSDQLKVSLSPLPKADFTILPVGNRFVFQNTSQFGLSTFWDFGDGTSSSQTSPIHEYMTTGNFKVMLVVTNDCGTDTAFSDITTSLEEAFFPGELRVFPQPVDQRVMVELIGTDLHQVSLEVTDLRGRTVASKLIGHLVAGTTVKLDVPALAQGMYQLKIKSDAYQFVRKLMVR